MLRISTFIRLNDSKGCTDERDRPSETEPDICAGSRRTKQHRDHEVYPTGTKAPMRRVLSCELSDIILTKTIDTGRDSNSTPEAAAF